MDKILLIIFLAMIIEYLVDIIKPVIPPSDYPIPLIISLITGLALGLLVQVDILAELGFTPITPWIGYILAGLIAAGGSNKVHELIAKLRASRKDI